jgi:hypothetical protein
VQAFFIEANVVYSEPIYVDQNLDYKSTSEMINFCEVKLNELQSEAERLLC